MKKIPSLFEWDFEKNVITDKIHPGCEWVLAGEGVATEKMDGTACMIRGGRLYKRYDAKNGKTPPPNFEPCQLDPDPVTGHFPGWVPVGDGPDEQWHRDGFAELVKYGYMPDGTYELVGAKVQGNPYNLSGHLLLRHGATVLHHVPRDPIELAKYLHDEPGIEGIVFHRENGDMCKVKRRDFGYKWPPFKEA